MHHRLQSHACLDVLPSAKARGFFLALASYADAPVGVPPHARGGRHRPNYWAGAQILASDVD
ncbi:MAG: hypothetical protein OWU33_14155, partial [Firmicutes bacterium]|nr:hypothetical protein [Bacillota bacterium]